MSLLTSTAPRRPRFHDLDVARVERLTPRAVAVTIDVPEGLAGEFAHLPGQYVTLRADIAGKDVRQSYSICQPPRVSRTTRTVRVGIARVDGGRMSTWATESLAAGDCVAVLPPMGEFTPPPWDGTTSRVHVLAAVGSGITPMLSIAPAVLEDEPTSRVVLLHGTRDEESTMFRGELAALADRYPGRARVVHVHSGAAGDDLVNGRIDPERLERLLAAHVPHVDVCYLSGPGAFVEASRARFLMLGVPPERIRQEIFLQGPQRSASATSRA